MLQYLMENCVLFDYMVICLFQGYYLILIVKKHLEKNNNNNNNKKKSELVNKINK